MTQITKVRLASAFVFAVLVVIVGWILTEFLGFSPDGLPTTIAITLALGSGMWAFVVNNLQPEAPKPYLIKALQFRPLLLSFGLFVSLLILWGIARAVIEWTIEPNTYDYGPCSSFFASYPCGEQDLNSGKRFLATDLADKIASAVFLLAPLSLAIRKIRKAFNDEA
jgi:hypothetical protein